MVETQKDICAAVIVDSEMKGRLVQSLKQESGLDRVESFDSIRDFLHSPVSLRCDLLFLEDRLRKGESVRIRLELQNLPAKIAILAGELHNGSLLEAIQDGAYGLIARDKPDEINRFVQSFFSGGTYFSPVYAKELVAVVKGKEGIVEKLSSREKEVLRLILAGGTAASVARKLDISVNTVLKHIRNIYTKLGVRNRASLVLKVKQSGLLF